MPYITAERQPKRERRVPGVLSIPAKGVGSTLECRRSLILPENSDRKLSVFSRLTIEV